MSGRGRGAVTSAWASAIRLAALGVLLCLLPATARANAIDDMLYTSMASSPCVRLMSATGDVGCSTPYKSDGTSGLLFLVDSATSIEEFRALDDGHSRAVLLAPTLFTGPVLERLSTPLLAGIIVLPGPKPAALSPSSSAPQGLDGLSPSYPWNPHGSDMLAARYEFPIVRVSQSEADTLSGFAAANHAAGVSTFPQKAVHFTFDMGPAGLTSLSCLRNAQCLPLGGHSVWGTMQTLNAAKKMVFMTTNLDSTAMFHDKAVGAASAASDIVALLAAVEALSKVDTASLPFQIGYGLFQGESWGRLGSRRFVSEIQGFACSSKASAASSVTGFAFCKQPVRTDLSFEELPSDGSGFAHVLAIDQAGGASANTYLHPAPGGSVSAGVLNGAVSGSQLPVVASSVSEVPPSPLTTFVKAWPGVNGAVLSSYDALYANQFYKSSWDDSSNVDAAQVAKFATTLARVAYALAANVSTTVAATAAVPAGLTVDTTLVSDLLNCFTTDAACDTLSSYTMLSTSSLRALTGGQGLSLYTGTNKPARAVTSKRDGNTVAGFIVSPSVAELAVRSFLAKQTASVTGAACTSSSSCKEADTKLECIAKQCVVPTAHYHEALSSALVSLGNGGYNLFESELDEPGADPMWTEPYWSGDIGIKTFTAGDPATGVTMLLVGLVVVVASVGLLCVARRRLAVHLKIH